MRFINISQLNKTIKNDAAAFIEKTNRDYTKKVGAVASSIADNIKEKPLVLLSGPSGSGKTTTAYRIKDALGEIGINSHIVSMDNYFITNSKLDEKSVPRDEEGNIDLESPYRVDIPLFQEQMKLMSEGQKVDIPVFDFVTQEHSSYIPLTRKKDEIIIIEGIHALNPEVTGSTGEKASCVYVSVRTRLKTDNGDILHPSQVRLMRRLIRDRLFRGRSFDDIFAMFTSVQRGENLYIMPHKYRADYDVDTFIDYEASVYKSIIYDELKAYKETAFPDLRKMTLRYLKELEPISAELIPDNSLIKEFIG
ncbi:MAG: nucleoside kinase [Ruminococcus sp.]|nr:nucleoside kinase [Ruminococcus sp.]MBR6645962.1 nucleoside kinase [Clostridia bacterium]